MMARILLAEDDREIANLERDYLEMSGHEVVIAPDGEEAMKRIWGYDYMSDSATVTVHINRIREKIEEDPKNPKIIETVWGAGYRLNMK